MFDGCNQEFDVWVVENSGLEKFDGGSGEFDDLQKFGVLGSNVTTSLECSSGAYLACFQTSNTDWYSLAAQYHNFSNSLYPPPRCKPLNAQCYLSYRF